MKKTTTQKKEKDFFHIVKTIDDVALIYSSISGRSGLLNTKTGKLIGTLDYYSTEDNSFSKIFIQTKNDPVSMNYYDVKRHEYIVYDFEVVKSFGSVFLLRSKVDNKTYLFDEKTYQDSSSIFNIEVEDAEYLFPNNSNKVQSLVLTFHGKKALYRKGKGLFTEFKYDDVEAKAYITILRNDDKYSFAYNDHDGGVCSSISEEFQQIETAKNSSSILYCYRNGYIYIYDLAHRLLVLQTAKKTEFIDDDCYNNECNEYLFYVMNDNKKEILSSVVNKKSNEIKLSTLISGCDEIIRDKKNSKAIFYIEKNGKKGVFCGTSLANGLIEPSYLETKLLMCTFHGDFYAANTSKYSSDIVKLELCADAETIVKDCHIVNMTSRAIIYSQKNFKKEKYGLLFPKEGYDAVVIPATSTSIKALSNCFYETEEKNKKGMYYLEKLIIPKKYRNIQCAFSSQYSNLDNASNVYFSLEKGKSSILAQMSYFQYERLDKVGISVLGEYDDISFFKDIIVCRTLDKVYIFNYDHILLGEFPSNAMVSSVGLKSWKNQVYNIDGIYYEYLNNKLIRLYQDTINSYVTTYETDTDIFEVSTFNQPALEEFSDHIDSIEDNLSSEKLTSYSLDKNILKGKYPALTLTRKPKVN